MQLSAINLASVIVNLETVIPIILSLIAVCISLMQDQRQKEERLEQRNKFINDLINREDDELREWVNEGLKEILEKQAVITKDLATVNALLSRTVINLNTLTIRFNEHTAKFGHDSSLTFFQDLNIWKSRMETLLLDLKTQLNKLTNK